ncbi:MAG: hypothetical protein J3K34DRAFT_410499 [Monoraphidium minutum]|nr:MAG: hypothetical protein J3K34DRAFT_410499 [Monoraphidium minutum]
MASRQGRAYAHAHAHAHTSITTGKSTCAPDLTRRGPRDLARRQRSGGGGVGMSGGGGAPGLSPRVCAGARTARSGTGEHGAGRRVGTMGMVVLWGWPGVSTGRHASHLQAAATCAVDQPQARRRSNCSDGRRGRPNKGVSAGTPAGAASAGTGRPGRRAPAGQKARRRGAGARSAKRARRPGRRVWVQRLGTHHS